MNRLRLSTRFHGFLDYVGGLALLLSPWLIGSGIAAPAALPFLVAGSLFIGIALLTDFELGMVRVVQVPLHLWIDGLLGLLFALTPWLLGFYRVVWLPHVAIGIGIVILAFLTQTVPSYERRGAGMTSAR